MSLHIHRFLDLIKSTEARGQRDIYMPLKDAKDLSMEITRLLLTLENLRSETSTAQQTIEVKLSGGDFKTPS
jgi:hypothetical protein